MVNSFLQEFRGLIQPLATLAEAVTGYPIGKVVNVGYALLGSSSSDITSSVLQNPAVKGYAIMSASDGISQLASSIGLDGDDPHLKSLINFVSYKIYDIASYALVEPELKMERISRSNTYNQRMNTVSEGQVIQTAYGDHIVYPQATTLATLTDWSNYDPSTPNVNPPDPEDGEGTEERAHILYAIGLGDYAVRDVLLGDTTLTTDATSQEGHYTLYGTNDNLGGDRAVETAMTYVVPSISNLQLLPATRVESNAFGLETDYNNYFIRGRNTDNDIIRVLPIATEREFYPTPSGEQIDRYRFHLVFPNGRGFLNPPTRWLVQDTFGIALEQRIEDLDGNIVPQPRIDNMGDEIPNSEGTQWNLIAGADGEDSSFLYRHGAMATRIPITMQDTKIIVDGDMQSSTTSEVKITVEGTVARTLEEGQRFKFRIRAFHWITVTPTLGVGSTFTTSLTGQYIGDTSYKRLPKACTLKSFEVVLSESSIINASLRNRTGTTLLSIMYSPVYRNQSDFDAPNFVRSTRLSVVATRILPVYDGTQWVMQQTRSPVWAIVDVLTNQTYGARLDRDTNLFPAELRTLALELEAEEVYYDEVIDRSATPLSIIINIADLFSLIVYQHGHVFRIRRDRYSTQIDFLLTEVDAMSDSNLVIEFPSEERSRALVATFITRGIWQKRTIRSGELVASPKTLTLTGITEASRAQQYIDRKRLRAQYRNTKFTLRIAYVGMLLFPTQIVGVAHSLFNQNNSTGEVVTFTNITDDMGVVTGADFTLNDDVTGDGFIMFRLRDGERSHVYPVTRVERNAIRITGDVTPLDNNIITNLSRRRTQYTFAQNQADLYTICKVLSVKPISDVSTDVELLVEDERAYL